MAVRIPQPIRSKLESMIDSGFSMLNHAWFSATYQTSSERMFREADKDLEILEDGKRLSKFEREKDMQYMRLRNHYGRDKKYCPGRIKESWLTEEDQFRYLEIRVKIDEALDDSGYIYHDK